MRHFKANISNRFLKILFGCQINVAEESTSILPSLSLLKITSISFWYQFVLTAFPSIVIK
jgi:hypothetical protein